jgi:cleavage stimulation factor subunit 3
MSYVWHTSVGKHEEAVNILKEGIKANPARSVILLALRYFCLNCFPVIHSFVLNFAYAEEQETKKDKEGVFATYDKFIEILRADLEALESRIKSANSSFESTTSNNTVPANGSNIGVPSVAATGLTEAGIHSNNSSFNTQSSDEKPPKSKGSCTCVLRDVLLPSKQPVPYSLGGEKTAGYRGRCTKPLVRVFV